MVRICLVLALCALTGCYGDTTPDAQDAADGQPDTGGQPDAAIQFGGHAVHRPDERAGTATDHCQPQGGHPQGHQATTLAR